MYLQSRKGKGKSHRRDSVGACSPPKGQKSSRSAIELPTTEPEFYFYTSEEECEVDRMVASSSLRTIKAHQRHASPLSATLAAPPQPPLQPATLEPIGVAIPPELIITGAQSKAGCNDTDASAKHKLNEKAIGRPHQMSGVISELPPISNGKRNNSWHNFRKCVPILRYARNLDKFICYQLFFNPNMLFVVVDIFLAEYRIPMVIVMKRPKI